MLESVFARRCLDKMRRWHSWTDASSTHHHPHHRRLAHEPADGLRGRRQPYKVGPSRCTVPPVDTYPVRSPLSVSDFLIPRARGKLFCEIGTRNGDIAACVKDAGVDVLVVEIDAEYCAKMRARGLTVVCKGVEKLGEAELGECGTFFWWPMMAPSQNEPWLRQLATMQARIGRNATVYVAHDTANPYDMGMLPRLAKQYAATSIDRIFFDEGGSLDGPAPSYTHDFVGRLGHWGVFHMARFDVGPRFVVGKSLLEEEIGAVEIYRPRPPGGVPSAPVRDGFCETTTNNAGHCARDQKGSVTLGGPLGIKTLDDCVNFCYERCRNCRVVSFSRKENDCSWFASCRMNSLRTDVGGFVSRRVGPHEL